MGTPHFALPSLRALHEAGHNIVAVYTQPPRPAGRGQKETPSPVHQYALEHNLPIHTPVSLKTPEAQATFASHKANAAIVTAYGLLLPKPILDAYPLGCLNVHPSLLPRWRGAAPLQRTIMAGDKETAIVIMQMNEGLDTGDMLLVKKYPIADGATAGQLHDDLAEEAGPLLLQTLDGLATGTITPTPQSEQGVLYAKKITKEETALDFTRPATELRQHILGLSPAPGATFTLNGQTIKAYDAEVMSATGTPGTVLDDQLTIACGKNALRLTIIQYPGKKRLSATESLHGHPIPKGTKVG